MDLSIFRLTGIKAKFPVGSLSLSPSLSQTHGKIHSLKHAIKLPSMFVSDSSLDPNTQDHRCIAHSGSLHDLYSFPDNQGPDRNYRWPTAYLSISGRTETSRD